MNGACAHCGSRLAVLVTGGTGAQFCCPGCAAAYGLVQSLGLGRYYERRETDPRLRTLKPDPDAPAIDYDSHVQRLDGINRLHLMVEGLHCAACVWLIESVLARDPRIREARVNLSTKRLVVSWPGAAAEAASLIRPVCDLGYRLVPYDPERLRDENRIEETALLRALAVAGFAAGNIMLLSVSVWAGAFEDMGPATRELMHWVSALIALPAVAYAGRPFFRSAGSALRARRLNMDVPISLAVLLATGMSLLQTLYGAQHVYFDAAVTLLFFLLIGRYLDRRARGLARSAAQHLLALGARAVTVVDAAGNLSLRAAEAVKPGEIALVAAGERIGVDGRILDGRTDLDTALITGESVPQAAAPGKRVYAGTLNLTAPVRIVVEAAGEGTLLAEIVRLVEAAERARTRYTVLAERVARAYAPAVHGVAAAAFVGWLTLGGAGWQDALMIAIATLIVTCPCALALAVPMVQVVASGRLLRHGILVKSGTALERLAGVDTVVFDKTGTLTLGRPVLRPGPGGSGGIDDESLTCAAALAAASRHPLARALAAAVPGSVPPEGVQEIPGCGLEAVIEGRRVRLGSRAWCADEAEGEDDFSGPELFLAIEGRSLRRFVFDDALREDAAEVVLALKRGGFDVRLLSGDRAPVVAAVAGALGIESWQAAATPERKVAILSELAAAGRHVLMVGDGLNDAPALAAASVSLSPASASEMAQMAADVVFQGDRLGPVAELLTIARQAGRRIRQNLTIALLYNTLTVPLAIAGFVTPLVAAAAMSSSSLVVVVNALRLGRGRRGS